MPTTMQNRDTAMFILYTGTRVPFEFADRWYRNSSPKASAIAPQTHASQECYMLTLYLRALFQ